jgi:hypothetical protein
MGLLKLCGEFLEALPRTQFRFSQQRLSLFQVEAIQAFGETAVDPSEHLASLIISMRRLA